MGIAIQRELERFLEEFNATVYSANRTNTVFRGESKDFEETSLLSSLGRFYPWDDKSEPEQIELFTDMEQQRLENRYKQEKNGINLFKSHAYPHLAKDHWPDTELEWHILAQHYSFPTRLLDWTTNPLVALFFAVESDDEDDAYLYSFPECDIIDDLGMVNLEDAKCEKYQANSSGDYAPWLPKYAGNLVFVRPKYTDQRYKNQAAVLMCPKSPYSNLATLWTSRLNIPHQIKPHIRRYLRTVGIDTSFIYPSLEGAARTTFLKIKEDENRILY